MAGGGGGGAVPVRGRASTRVHPFPSSANAAASSSSSSAAASPTFRVFCKGRMAAVTDDEPVLAVAVCGPQGEVVLRGHRPALGFVGRYDDDSDDGQVLLEAMALVEGLHVAVVMDVASVEAVTDHRTLHNYMLGLSRPTGEKITDMINQALLMRKQFERCEITLVKLGQVSNIVKLSKEGLDVEIARYLAKKEKRERCMICFDDVDTTKFHVVEGCLHRFCLPCMKKHMQTMLRSGTAPRCPQPCCTTKLTMEEGSKVLLSSRFLEMMAQHVREEYIHPSQRIYCPYPKCSALMSLSEMQGSSCTDDATTLRKCVKCGEPMCVNCKVAWHERMSCLKYQRCYPHGGPEGESLQKLVRQRRWKRCGRCSHMIELAMGCESVLCVCGNRLCYICGKTYAEDGSCGCTDLAARRQVAGCFPLPVCLGGIRR